MWYSSAMTIGERLLNLVSEYQESMTDRFEGGDSEGAYSSREPEVIAADYEVAVLELLRQDS